ncbi:MAG: hypothetical protein WKG01_25200 [Kofleriaceae bacterium]
MHPYRESSNPHAVAERGFDPELQREDLIFGALLLGVGGVRIAIAVVQREAFGTEVTIAMMMTVIGLVQIVASLLRRRHHRTTDGSQPTEWSARMSPDGRAR